MCKLNNTKSKKKKPKKLHFRSLIIISYNRNLLSPSHSWLASYASWRSCVSFLKPTRYIVVSWLGCWDRVEKRARHNFHHLHATRYMMTGLDLHHAVVSYAKSPIFVNGMATEWYEWPYLWSVVECVMLRITSSSCSISIAALMDTRLCMHSKKY